MPELSHIDPRNSALLVMDYQVDALTKFMTAAQSADAIACVPDLIAMARDAGMMVIHVVTSFLPRYRGTRIVRVSALLSCLNFKNVHETD
jgi:nicotinamidase-related amidase